MLRAIAKDIQNNPAKPGEMVPTLPSTSPNMYLIKSTVLPSPATFVLGICVASVNRGSFILVALCDFSTVTGVLVNKKEKSN